MSFPTIAATANGNSGGTSNTHVVTLPTGISSGDLLLVFFTNQQGATNAPSITTPSSGWTQMFTANQGSGQNLTVWYRVADGSEASTITATLGASGNRSAAWACYRITGYTGTPENGTAAGATSSTPNCPNVAPSWGSDDNLFIAAYGWRANVSHSSYPTNYSQSQLTDRWANTNGCGIAVAGRNLTGASDDPGNAGIGASTINITNTIVVRGTSSGVTGTGDTTFPVAAIDASGSETISGTSTTTLPVAAISASGSETISGSASLVFPVAAIGGAGSETVSGSGDASLPVAAIDGSGSASAPQITPPSGTIFYGGFGGSGPLIGNMRAPKPTKPRKKKPTQKYKPSPAIIEAIRYQQAREEDDLFMMMAGELT